MAAHLSAHERFNKRFHIIYVRVLLLRFAVVIAAAAAAVATATVHAA